MNHQFSGNQYWQRNQQSDVGLNVMQERQFHRICQETRAEHRQHLRVVESGATLPIDTQLEAID